MQVGRITYEPSSTYCNKVFIGNWFEDRSNYKKSRLPITTTYNSLFSEKPYSANDPFVLWKIKIENEGFGPRLMTDHGTGEYLDNMSTLYDLSYNYYPKCANGPLHRKLRSKIPKFIPEDDYLPSFGNLTKYGILELKQEQWKCDKGVVRRTGTTSYQETYLPPKKEDYLFKKWAVPLCNSSKLDKSDQQAIALRLRDSNYSTMKTNETLKPVCRERRCNPITWECPDGKTLAM